MSKYTHSCPSDKTLIVSCVMKKQLEYNVYLKINANGIKCSTNTLHGRTVKSIWTAITNTV